MDWLRRLVGWRRDRDVALGEELEAHRALVQDSLERAGRSPAEAAAESRRQMGNVTLALEDAREVWMIRWVDQLRQYIRYGLRGLRREPVFALTAILTLGLGTAATTSVFSIVDAEVWRPLPYPQPHRLVAVHSQDPAPPNNADPISVEEFSSWRRAADAFVSLAGSANTDRRTVQLDHAESMSVTRVTANYFSTLGRTAMLGRVFTDDDARGSTAVVLGARGWRRVFDADPNIIGRTLILDDEPKVVVGVVAEDDSIGPDAEMFQPIDERAAAPADGRGIVLYGAVARLAPGATAEAGRAQLQAEIDRRGAIDAGRRGHRVAVDDLSEFYTKSDKRPLYFFLGASALVLILTIVNVAALVLSRTFRRGPEFALRGALGGGTHAIAMQLVVEAALIAIPGCALGLLFAYQTTGLAGQVIPDDFLLRGTRIVVDLRVMAFSFAIAMATIAGLVMIPIGIARRASMSAAMGSGSRACGSPSTSRMRHRLLVAQLSLTVILLAGAGVFLKSFAALTHVPIGFDASDGWSMRVAPSGPRFAADAPLRAYGDELLRQARAIHGVRDVALATTSPLRSGWIVMATEPGAPSSGEGTRAIFRSVSTGYFRTIGTPILRGRGIVETDVPGAPAVAVINETLARRMFADGDPIGRQIAFVGVHAPVRAATAVVVGVAANVKEVGLNEVAFGDMYVAFAQHPYSRIELLARGSDAGASMPQALRGAAAGADPSVPVTGIAMLDERVHQAIQADRFNLIVVVGFAMVAVLIAAIGIYGALAYAASARWREFGVRLALGATPGGLLGAALWDAARLGLVSGAIGVAITVVIGVWLGDALYLVPGAHNGLLFEVKATDPVALAGSLAGVVIVSLLAGAIPARRVARVDPAQALRAE